MDNDGSRVERNIFQENDLMNFMFNEHKRERMVELCGEDWVLQQESENKLRFILEGEL